MRLFSLLVEQWSSLILVFLIGIDTIKVIVVNFPCLSQSSTAAYQISESSPSGNQQ